MSEARSSFDEARYPEAAAQYRALLPELALLTQAEQLEYALYRGATHLALGDALAAQRWLSQAKRLSELRPELATAEERGRLASAWRALGHMPGD